MIHTDNSVSELVINELTSEQYETLKQQGLISNNELYMVKGESYPLTSDLANVAFSGDYNDLTNTPYIPSGVVVDQTYNALSTNAQSGVAVAEAFTNTFVITNSSEYANITPSSSTYYFIAD